MIIVLCLTGEYFVWLCFILSHLVVFVSHLAFSEYDLAEQTIPYK